VIDGLFCRWIIGCSNPNNLLKVVQMNYVSSIASSILSHSLETGSLGPEYYTAIAEWEKREIPVAIVLISLDEVYSQGATLTSPSVELIQDTVNRNFRTWLVHGNGNGGMPV